MYKNRLKKGFRFFMDFETSGFKNKNHQILTGAIIVKNDLTGKTVHAEEFKVKLKKGVLPSVGAIKTNKLAPWSDKFNSEAITEYELIQKVSDLTARYTVTDEIAGFIKPKFTAYNSDFDAYFAKIAFSRSGKRFEDHFNKSITDPLKTVRGLVKEGLIKTVKGSRGNSSKLTDVAKALKIEFKGGSHTAMADTEVLAKVYEKAMEIKTGKNPYSETSSSPELFNEGEIIRVKTNSTKSGVKDRHILVIKNAEEEGKIIALDLDDIRTNKGYSDSSVRQFNYHTIISEEMPSEEDTRELEVYAREFRAEIEEKTKEITDSFTKTEDDQEFDSLVSDGEFIESVEEGIFCEEFTFDDIRDIMRANGKDEKDISAVMTKAHQLSIAKGRQGIKDIGPIRVWDNFADIKNEFIEFSKNMDPSKMEEGDWAIVEYFEWLESKEPSEFRGEEFSKLRELRSQFLLADRDVINSQVTVKTKVEETGLHQRCVICGKKLRSKKTMLTGIGSECAALSPVA